MREPFEQRVNETQLATIISHCDLLSIPRYQIDDKPLWQIALILQSTQAMQLDYNHNTALIIKLSNKPINKKAIIELEGIERQVALLLDFPQDGAQLLEDTLKNWHENARALQIMINWWLNYTSESTLLLCQILLAKRYLIF